jgi:prephenate dehydrogenase
MAPLEQVTVVGVGLLGGSLALAVRKRGLAARVVGADRCPEALRQALSAGLIDEAAELPAAVAGADLVVFCAPVDQIAPLALQAAPHCRPGALLTDVGSTKAGIVRALAGQLPESVTFVGSHPIAGSEKQGPEYAWGDLFEGRVVVLAPEDGAAPAAGRLADFWRALGARPVTMSPEEHDRALALTSHLPHLLSSALAGVLPPEWRALTGSGFRDVTRLALGGPGVWGPIFRANAANVLEALARLEGQLAELRLALARPDGPLDRLLAEARQAREALAEGGGRSA